jgi:hypothetical protein
VLSVSRLKTSTPAVATRSADFRQREGISITLPPLGGGAKRSPDPPPARRAA